MRTKIYGVVASQLPNHIEESYPLFVEFIIKYYKFMEEYQFNNGKAGPLAAISDFSNSSDVDTATDYFLEKYQQEMGGVISTAYAAKKSLFLKHLVDVYKTKGTEESIKILFRIIFDSECSTYAPSKYILIPSDGVYVVPFYMIVYAVTGNPFDLKGMSIRGTISNSSAFVESVIKYYTNGVEKYHIFLNRASIQGDFTNDEFLTDGSGSIVVRSEEI